MNDDADLLRRYANRADDAAFTALVQRHVDFVYSAALRQLNGDAHLAADATQLVFTHLARKAATVARHRVLAGWLFTSTRYVTANLIRGERRRQAREQEAHFMQEITRDHAAANQDWDRVRPVLDDVLGELNAQDREAILLRFFQGCDYGAVGARFAIAENTARMRVERALDKLRLRLERRGVTSTSAALAVVLGSQAVAAAPAGLVATVAGAVLSGGGVAAGIATGSGVAGGLTALVNFMSMTKVQLGLSGALAAAGATGFVIQADTNARLRDEIAALRATGAGVVDLQAENQRLARQIAEVDGMRGDDGRFERLQQEAVALRGRLEQLAQAEAARAASRSAARNVYDISQLDRTPSPRFQSRPQYPVEMRQAGISGEVVVEFVVDRDGAVTNAFALRSSRPEFEAAAVAAVSSWKFRPGQKGGQDVDTRLQIPIVFTLSEGEVKTGNMKVTALPATPGATPAAEPPFVVQHSGPAGTSATPPPR